MKQKNTFLLCMAKLLCFDLYRYGTRGFRGIRHCTMGRSSGYVDRLVSDSVSNSVVGFLIMQCLFSEIMQHGHHTWHDGGANQESHVCLHLGLTDYRSVFL